MFGYTRKEAVGLAFFDLINGPDEVDSYKKAMDTVSTGRDQPEAPVTLELKARRRNGEEFPVSLTLARKETMAGWLAAAAAATTTTTTTLIIRDITERKKAEKQISTDLQAMSRLQKLGTLSLHEANLEPILLEVVDTAIAISGADFGNLQILDPETSDLKIEAQRGFLSGGLTSGTPLARAKGLVVQRWNTASVS